MHALRPGVDEDVTIEQTVAETPQSRGLALSTRTPPSRTTRADNALHAEEAERAGAFALVLAVLCAVATLGLPFQKAPGWLSGLTAATLLSVVGLCLWVWRRTRTSARYGPRVFRLFAVGCGVAAFEVVYYGGFFSPAPVVVVLGLNFFALGDDRRFTIWFCSCFVGCYLVLTSLTAVGLIPEHSLLVFPEAELPGKVFATLVTTACLAITLWHARLARRATRKAVERLSEALEEVQQREALLEELNQDLEQARRADAGKRGRFSGTRAGDYALGELVGRGAMGEVYAASHCETGAPAAVKVLSDEARDTSGYLERFRREARIASQLAAENLVQVFAVGDLEEGTPFIAMELLAGHDLAWHLRKRRRLPPDEVAYILRQIARGVQVAHDAGIVHRDLKPNNLFLHEPPGGEPVWKVLDFGVSKERESVETLTHGAIVGTPGYMSPEQARGESARAQSDVFALGSVSYRALTGRAPFSAPDMPRILYRLVYRQPTRPSQIAVRLHADLDAVLAIALAKDPKERFASVTALAEALEQAAGGTLDPALRHRAQAILERHPWGSRVASPD